MTTFKVACLDNIRYCKFPNEVKSLPEFVAYLNAHYHSFIKLDFYVENKCVAPYFLSNATETHYVNPSHIRQVKEVEIHLLAQEEYDEKLAKVVSEKCVRCMHYTEDDCDWNLDPFCEHINLDGECYGFERKKSN